MIIILEKTKVIAEYDGWVYSNITDENNHLYKHPKPTIGRLNRVNLERMCYYNSMDWLYGVTLKVHDELLRIFNFQKTKEDFVKTNHLIHEIKFKIFISVEDLFNAVYNGILHILKFKENEK